VFLIYLFFVGMIVVFVFVFVFAFAFALIDFDFVRIIFLFFTSQFFLFFSCESNFLSPLFNGVSHFERFIHSFIHCKSVPLTLVTQVHSHSYIKSCISRAHAFFGKEKNCTRRSKSNLTILLSIYRVLYVKHIILCSCVS
jgi:hypothetical protein